MRGKRAKFFLIGGRLCLDFANTVYPADQGGAVRSWDDLVDFLEAAGAIGAEPATRMRKLGRSDPRGCARAFVRGLELRDAIRHILQAATAGKPAPTRHVEVINRVLRDNQGHEALSRGRAGWQLAFRPRHDRAVRALAVIARSAAELVAESLPARVRKCANPKCVLYFYDPSPSGRRRWCCMTVCGNRMKVAAHARRQAKAGGNGSRSRRR